MSWLPRAKSSIARIGTSTFHELITAGCLSVLGLAVAFWRGALIAAIILGVGGLLWTLSRYKRPPKAETNKQGQTYKVRYFLIRSPALRRKAHLAGLALFAVGVGVLVVTVAMGTARVVQQGQDKSEQLDTIEDNTELAKAERDKNQAELLAAIKAGPDPITDDYIRQMEQLKIRNKSLIEQNQSLEDDNDNLREQVASALLAQAESELDKGKSVEEILAELRAGSPRDLLAFLDEQVFVVEQVLDDNPSSERARETAIARHRERAEIAYPLGEIAKAEHSLTRILQLAPDDLGALNDLGHIRRLHGELDEAQRLYTRVLDEAPGEFTKAAALGNLGVIEQIRDNLDAAQDYHTQSLAIHEDLGFKHGVAATLTNLGVIERARGNLDAAQDYQKRSLAIHKQLGNKRGMAAAINNLGVIEQLRGNLDAAQDYHSQALAIDEQLGNKQGMADSLNNLGVIEWSRGNRPEACTLWRRSLALYEQVGAKPRVDLLRAWISEHCPDPPG